MAYNRKDFLKTAAAVTAGLTVAPSLLSFDEDHKLKRYGIQLYTVRNDVFKNLKSTIEYVAKAGYTQIELFGYDGKSFFGKSAKEFRAMFDANGLTAPSGHYYLPPVLYNGDKEMWKVAIEAASTMGNKYMVVPWLDDKHRGAEDFKKLVGTINELAVLTKAAGMKLAYHNHDFEFGKADDGKTFLEHLLNGTDKGMVDFEMDIYWVVYANQNPVEWFQKYPGRFSMWHVKDMTKNTKGESESTQVGDGTIDFTTIYANRKLSGLKYGFVEQEAYTMPEEQCIKKSIDYLKKKNWGNG